MTAPARRPSRSSVGLVALAGAVVPIATATGGVAAAAIGTASVLIAALGVLSGRQRVVDVGAIAAFAGVVAAAAADAPVPAVLAGLVGTVLLWDLGSTVVVLGEQLGREADTVRVEALHGIASGAVGFTAAGVGFAVYRLGPAGQPQTTLFVLLVAAALLLAALNR